MKDHLLSPDPDLEASYQGETSVLKEQLRCNRVSLGQCCAALSISEPGPIREHKATTRRRQTLIPTQLSRRRIGGPLLLAARS